MAKTKSFKPRRHGTKARRGHGRGKKARHGKRAGRRHAAAFAGMGAKGTLFGLDVAQAVFLGVGAVGTGMLNNVVIDHLPASMAWAKTGWGKVGTRAALTIGIGLVAKKAAPAKFANPLIVGSLAGLGIDVVTALVSKFVPAAPLSGYEPIEDQLAALELAQPGSLQGLLTVDGGSLNGLGGPFDIDLNPLAQ